MAAQSAANKVTDAIDTSTKQVEEVQAALLTTAKQSALASIDIYEKSVGTVLEFQNKFVGSTGFAAIDDFVAAQTKLIGDLNATGVTAARSILA
ncbi:MAG: hypothetical protein WBA98_17495 [Gordonia sp. (in: high G+C Gram-positive bacteria)]|uniref:hypothetical protein n=1 Tax=Gordonia sp. (in: high G+C Gram-positive bacteria) TaxID=84139 RepID=UPI003C742307